MLTPYLNNKNKRLVQRQKIQLPQTEKHEKFVEIFRDERYNNFNFAQKKEALNKLNINKDVLKAETVFTYPFMSVPFSTLVYKQVNCKGWEIVRNSETSRNFQKSYSFFSQTKACMFKFIVKSDFQKWTQTELFQRFLQISSFYPMHLGTNKNLNLNSFNKDRMLSSYFPEILSKKSNWNLSKNETFFVKNPKFYLHNYFDLFFIEFNQYSFNCQTGLISKKSKNSKHFSLQKLLKDKNLFFLCFVKTFIQFLICSYNFSPQKEIVSRNSILTFGQNLEKNKSNFFFFKKIYVFYYVHRIRDLSTEFLLKQPFFQNAIKFKKIVHKNSKKSSLNLFLPHSLSSKDFIKTNPAFKKKIEFYIFSGVFKDRFAFNEQRYSYFHSFFMLMQVPLLKIYCSLTPRHRSLGSLPVQNTTWIFEKCPEHFSLQVFDKIHEWLNCNSQMLKIMKVNSRLEKQTFHSIFLNLNSKNDLKKRFLSDFLNPKFFQHDFLKKMKSLIKKSVSLSQSDLVSKLTFLMYTYAYYFSNVWDLKTIKTFEKEIFQCLWKWACRRHPNKSKKWIQLKYFYKFKSGFWVFGCVSQNLKTIETEKPTELSFFYLPLLSQILFKLNSARIGKPSKNF